MKNESISIIFSKNVEKKSRNVVAGKEQKFLIA